MPYPFPSSRAEPLKVSADELTAVILIPKGAKEKYPAPDREEMMKYPYPQPAQDSISIVLSWDNAIESDGVVRFKDVVLAKEMVQDYAGTKVFKPALELKAATRFAAFKPVTNDHPITETVKDPKLICGFIENPEFKNDSLVSDLALTDATLIAAVKSGDKREVSIGFHADWEFTPGTFNNQAYEAIQKNILIDHVAIVKAGRCSLVDGCGIHLDAKSHDSPSCEKAGCKEAIAAMQKTITDRLTALETSVKSDATLAAQLKTISESLDALNKDGIHFAVTPTGDEGKQAINLAYQKAFA